MHVHAARQTDTPEEGWERRDTEGERVHREQENEYKAEMLECEGNKGGIGKGWEAGQRGRWKSIWK